MPFDHNTPHSGNGTFTNPFTPWGPVSNNTLTLPPAAVFWQGYAWPSSFNAVHMSLIPKGPYQGMVLAWDANPVAGKEPPNAGLPPLAAGDYRPFQAYSIIDPANNPVSFRYRNYLLPMNTVYTPSITPGIDAENLFCAGHTWSPFGDLIVVGGTAFLNAFPAYGFLGGKMTYALNLDALWGTYPGVTNAWSPYADFGFWQRGPDLTDARWYPTATLTFPLTRTAVGFPPRDREIVLVLGGSVGDPNSLPPGTIQPTWNTFESLIVDARATPTSPALIKDSVGLPATPFVAQGPGTPPPAGSVDVDWFEEYPRCHMLSTGNIFFSGYAPRWAHMNPDVLPIAWTKAPSPPFSSNWQSPRHDAPSLLFPNIAEDNVDTILRIGGADTHFYFDTVNGTTATVESIAAGTPGATWTSEPALPPNSVPTTTNSGSRYLTNAVTLPTGGILLFGGRQRDPTGAERNLYEAFLFQNGVWVSMGMNPVLSIRDYHSTAVLLPDGRVFLGGGNGRNYDYEIFSPVYRTDPTLLAQQPASVVFPTSPPFHPDFDAFQLDYDTEFAIKCDPLPTGVALDRAVLMAPGSTTHHSDMCQRYVSMEITRQSGNGLTFKTPLDSKFAPRGIYMLFLATNSGAISDAIWVFLA